MTQRGPRGEKRPRGRNGSARSRGPIYRVKVNQTLASADNSAQRGAGRSHSVSRAGGSRGSGGDETAAGSEMH